MLNPALALHPALVALDLGDCMLGDEAINLICGLLPPDGAKSGEQGWRAGGQGDRDKAPVEMVEGVGQKRDCRAQSRLE